MGLRERFLTGGVAVPLALLAIFYDAKLCLSLVLVLQAICVQELSELLRRTRAARALATAGVGIGLLGSPFLFHIIAEVVCVVAAFAGRDASGVVMSAGMALLVIRRLALMRDHLHAAKRAADEHGGAHGPTRVRSKADAVSWPPPSSNEEFGSGSVKTGSAVAGADGKTCSPQEASAVVVVSSVGGISEVVEAGMFMLALEVSSMLWVVGGWSCLVALRFREPKGAADVAALLAIVFQSDNGGLAVGSLSKILGRKQLSSKSQPHQPAAAPAAAAGGPGLLTVASPNKTWAGVLGAIALGTATAMALKELSWMGFSPALLLSSSRICSSGLPGRAEAPFFSVEVMSRGHLCAAGIVVCVAGVVGDLWESLLKRTAMVKDSGTIFPGHGGCLDRLDGVLAAAPLYLAFVSLCGGGVVDQR